MINDPISQAGEPADVRLQSQANSPQRVLVVDDEVSMLLLSTEVLIHSGYEVDTAADGAAAWKKLNADRYDLLITDQNMPKLTGVELIKKLRAARMALPVIIATGVLPKEELTQCQPVGTLLKPYTTAQLLGAVKEVLCATDGAREQIGAPQPNWQNQPTGLSS